MAQKKQSEIINKLIGEVKRILLQLNVTTSNVKTKQGSLSQDQLNVLNANPFTTTLLNKLNSAITDLSAYMTSTQINQLLGGKQATLSQAQLAVLSGKPFTADLKTALDGLINGGKFLGDIAVDDTANQATIVQELRTKYGGTNEATRDPNLALGDFVEVIQAGAGAGDLTFTTYTYRETPNSMGIPQYRWEKGAVKTEHIKGGTVDAYTKAEADGRFAPLADVSMDDASILSLEAITITT